MNLELLYNERSNVFIENITNVSVSTTEVFFVYNNTNTEIPIRDLRTVTLFTDDWQVTIRHWVFNKE